MSTACPCTRDDLLGFKPAHDSFVGIDSDGCVFDTMEIKQKKCFHGLIISQWKLEPIAAQVRQTAEFVNLYSKWRGQNRFPALVMTFNLLREHPIVIARRIQIPSLAPLEAFIARESALGNPALERAVHESGNPCLATVLQWSKAVNAEVEKKVRNIPPFKWVRESLAAIQAQSDAICVSQTPGEALRREWHENTLTSCVRLIAGQELGTKAEHIAMATNGRYRPDRVLMIGDAMGDKKAARACHALFFPVNPGREETSWERFLKEAYGRFLSGTYVGAYEKELIAEFDSLLPENPPWKHATP